MPSDTPTPAEIAAKIADRLRALHFDGTTCEPDSPSACSNCYGGPKVMTPDELGRDLTAALAEHYHLLPKAEVQGPNASGDYIIPVKTRRPQDNPHIRIEPVNPWGERVMHPLAVPQPFRDPDLARGFAAALASAADVAEEPR
ncbi:hypothetical protein SEA_ECLIPTUS_81 [Gordonia phage Ecliptus]|nr:hypothetical protein SEA_ECLIPTUS_81 [Gordonia phage Ecliptus]